nr:unnamed protein product [Digitaria exilis]
MCRIRRHGVGVRDLLAHQEGTQATGTSPAARHAAGLGSHVITVKLTHSCRPLDSIGFHGSDSVSNLRRDAISRAHAHIRCVLSSLLSSPRHHRGHGYSTRRPLLPHDPGGPHITAAAGATSPSPPTPAVPASG